MASVSVSHMIIFIASIIVAASVAGVLTEEVSRLSSAIDDEGLDVANEIRTDVEVISDAGASNVYDDVNITLLVKNTGSRTIPVDGGYLDVVVDGEYQTNVTVEVVDADSWRTNDVARVNVTYPGLPEGDHRVQITVNGDEEVFEFRTS